MSQRSSLIAWRSRWTEVNRETSREAAAMPATERLRTLARLRAFAASGHVSPWPDDEADVWARFARLRTLYRARHAGR